MAANDGRETAPCGACRGTRYVQVVIETGNRAHQTSGSTWKQVPCGECRATGRVLAVTEKCADCGSSLVATEITAGGDGLTPVNLCVNEACPPPRDYRSVCLTASPVLTPEGAQWTVMLVVGGTLTKVETWNDRDLGIADALDRLAEAGIVLGGTS